MSSSINISKDPFFIILSFLFIDGFKQIEKFLLNCSIEDIFNIKAAEIEFNTAAGLPQSCKYFYVLIKEFIKNNAEKLKNEEYYERKYVENEIDFLTIKILFEVEDIFVKSCCKSERLKKVIQFSVLRNKKNDVVFHSFTIPEKYKIDTKITIDTDHFLDRSVRNISTFYVKKGDKLLTYEAIMVEIMSMDGDTSYEYEVDLNLTGKIFIEKIHLERKKPLFFFRKIDKKNVEKAAEFIKNILHKLKKQIAKSIQFNDFELSPNLEILFQICKFIGSMPPD
jgi:hypothetical protein